MMSQRQTTVRRLSHGNVPVSTNGKGRVPVSTTRLNLKLPNSVFNELQSLAFDSGRTMTEIVRIGLALAVLASDEEKAGRKLAVVDDGGKIVKEVVLAK